MVVLEEVRGDGIGGGMMGLLWLLLLLRGGGCAVMGGGGAAAAAAADGGGNGVDSATTWSCSVSSPSLSESDCISRSSMLFAIVIQVGLDFLGFCVGLPD